LDFKPKIEKIIDGLPHLMSWILSKDSLYLSFLLQLSLMNDRCFSKFENFSKSRLPLKEAGGAEKTCSLNIRERQLFLLPFFHWIPSIRLQLSPKKS